MTLFPLFAQYAQTEYNLAYGLVGTMIVLGVLLVCIPRPRKSSLFEEEDKKKSKKRRKKKKKKKKK